LSRADLDAFCEPFWRKDGSRTDRNHSGLGLALSRALCERTGLSLDFELTSGRLRAVLGVSAAREGPRPRFSARPTRDTARS
jgi:two-component system sensor histidine kinase QseC